MRNEETSSETGIPARVSDHRPDNIAERNTLEFEIIGCRLGDNYAAIADQKIRAIILNPLAREGEASTLTADELDEMRDLLEARTFLDDCISGEVGSGNEKCQPLKERMRRLRVRMPHHPSVRAIETMERNRESRQLSQPGNRTGRPAPPENTAFRLDPLGSAAQTIRSQREEINQRGRS